MIKILKNLIGFSSECTCAILRQAQYERQMAVCAEYIEAHILKLRYSEQMLIILLFAGMLIISCTSNSHKEIAYGGSVLIDSVTVAFLRSEYIVDESKNAWVGNGYHDGKQELLIYSVPQKKIISSTTITSGYCYPMRERPISFGKPWLMIGTTNDRLILYNISTKERIDLNGGYTRAGGISPDGKYAYYYDNDTTIVFSIINKKIFSRIYGTTTFYVAQNAEFYLFTILENPGISYKQKWIAKRSFNELTTDTLVDIPDTLFFLRMTDEDRSLYFIQPGDINSSLYDLESLINKKLSKVYEFKSPFRTGTDINTYSQIYTYSAGSDTYIHCNSGNYNDTSFLSQE